MEDRQRAALGLVCAAVLVCARPAIAGSAPFLQVAPLVRDDVIARDVRVRDAMPVIPGYVAASPAHRPVALIPLYGAFAGLQAADIHSTTRALRQGGYEMNPLMTSVAGSQKGFVAVKLAATATTIAASEVLWRSRPKTAVVVMAILTSGYGVIVAHNYRELH
jgi:hypothetical protein